MLYMTLQEVRERIDKNYECIREIEKLVPEQKQADLPDRINVFRICNRGIFK